MTTRLLAFAAVLLSASPALAFHEVRSFERTANTGGGNGYYYSGSPRSKGYDCNICHTDAEGRIAIELTSELSDGTYEPGTAYTIDVAMLGEHKGLDSAFNPNTFTAEFIGADGQPVGRVSAIPRSIVHIELDGSVAVAEGQGNGELEWTFFWAAPDTAEPVTLFMAMLDGDGANDPVVRFIDPLNDDVATLVLPLCPSGQTCEPTPAPDEERSAVDCSTGGSAPSWLVLLAAVAIGVRRRRTSHSS